MRSALCLSVAIGTAVAGAGIVVTTMTSLRADTAGHAVRLTAGPVDAYVDLVTNTFTNLGAIGARWSDDPLPTAVQLITNWAGYAQTTISSFVDTGPALADGLTNLPSQLQTLFHAITTGDVEAAIAMLIITVLSVNPIPALVDRLLEIPYDIAGNSVSAALATLHAAQLPIGVALIDAGQAAVAEIGLSVQGFVHDLQSGDFTGALIQLIEAPAQLLDAGLNSETPGLPGLLTAAPDLSQTGFVDAVVNCLPRAVAHAIGAPEALIGGDTPADLVAPDTGSSSNPMVDAAAILIGAAS